MRMKLFNQDCMEAMKEMDDNQFDLAIVDPPYGIDVNKMTLGSGKYKSDKQWDSTTPPKYILMNYFASQKIKLYGVQIT
jgi:site-specific DNA-methyltransferase (adenine-specific)